MLPVTAATVTNTAAADVKRPAILPSPYSLDRLLPRRVATASTITAAVAATDATASQRLHRSPSATQTLDTAAMSSAAVNRRAAHAQLIRPPPPLSTLSRHHTSVSAPRVVPSPRSGRLARSSSAHAAVPASVRRAKPPPDSRGSGGPPPPPGSSKPPPHPQITPNTLLAPTNSRQLRGQHGSGGFASDMRSSRLCGKRSEAHRAVYATVLDRALGWREDEDGGQRLTTGASCAPREEAT